MDSIPEAPWAKADPSRRNPRRRIPQAIAHRGYKAAWPENTMAGFRAAVSVGSHALETDLHLSSDGVVVLSHDPTLKRCYGVDAKIKDCSWEYLSTLETTREPKQKMPQLRELLEMLNTPGMESVWLLLDIKVDDAADDLVGAIARTLEDVPPGTRPWNQRVMLGCWNASFIKAARHHLPTYPMSLISFYLPYAHHFFPIPNLGYNLNQYALRSWAGAHFMKEARDRGKTMLTWTVNDVKSMEWCIRKNLDPRKQQQLSSPDSKEEDEGTESEDAAALIGQRLIDGVITDDPKLYLEVCERLEEELDGREGTRSKDVDAATSSRRQRMIKSGRDCWMRYVTYPIFAPLFFWLLKWQGRFDYFQDPGTLELQGR